MISQNDLVTSLCAQLPPDLHPHVPALARIIDEAMQRGRSASSADPTLRPLLEYLTGRRIQAGQSQISFGTDNRFNNVEIGDVAGGDIFHIEIGNVIGGNTFQLALQVPESARTNRRLALIMGGIGVVIVLAGAILFFFARSEGQRLAQTQLALAADIATNMSNLDTQIDYAQAALTDPLDTNTASSMWGNNVRQRVAGLQQAFNSRALAVAPNESLLQVLIDSKADPSLVQTFYTAMKEAQDDAQSLTGMMDGLANLTSTIDRAQRLKEIDLQRRMFVSSAQIAYLWGMLALDSLGTPHDEIAFRFGQLKTLSPRVYTPKENVLASLDAESKTLAGLIQERTALLQDAQQALDEALKIQPDDTWDKVVGKAIALRKIGAIEQSVAAFKRYGEMFAASDPTAAQYSTVAQAFSPQAGALGVESAMYIYDVAAGSAGQQASLQVGDIVLTLGGLPTPNATAFEAANSQLPAGPVMVETLRLQNDGTFTHRSLKITASPMGISVMPI